VGRAAARKTAGRTFFLCLDVPRGANARHIVDIETRMRASHVVAAPRRRITQRCRTSGRAANRDCNGIAAPIA